MNRSARSTPAILAVQLVIVAALSCVGCTPDASSSDAGGSDVDAPSGRAPCEEGFVCDNGLFCDGVESCEPSNPGADGNGCVAGATECTGSDEDCDDERDACVTCVRGGPDDRDGDGFCFNGSDCDDDDPDINPDAVEICLGQADRSRSIDEDCNRATLGPDRDGDGFSPTYCCNGGAGNCGLDCDDERMGVNPSAVDGCGGGDEDCDGTTDEEPSTSYYRDEDGDGYGVTSDVVRACGLPEGYADQPGDCDDGAPLINPSAREICDGFDNNCRDGIDEVAEGDPACECFDPGATRDCGDFAVAKWNVGQCRSGTQACGTDGQWGTCIGSVPPGDEFCGGGDEDCDGEFDEV